MARSRILSLDPNLDLPSAIKQIDTEAAGQSQAIKDFGASQDSNLTSVYGKLQGGLQQGVGTIQSIYGNAAGNVQAAYDRAGTGAQAAASQNQSSIGDFANRLGMDPRALAEVQGRLATQAATFEQRNRQSSAGRVSNIQQLGAGMASVAQLGVQAAQQAEAQGRADLSKKITEQLKTVQTTAAATKSGFTREKANQATKAIAEAQKGILQAQKEMMRESRAAARSARSDARADARAARSSSSSSSGPSWIDKFNMTQEAEERRYQRGRGDKQTDLDTKNAPDEARRAVDLEAREAFGRGNAYKAFVDVVNGDMTWADAQKTYKTPKGKKLNWAEIEKYVNKYPA